MADNDEEDLFGNDDEVMKQPTSQPIGENSNNNEQIDVNAIANLVQEAGGGGATAQSTTLMLKQHPPPDALPAGWYLKPSISSPGNFYYFNQDTGLCQWEYPTAVAAVVVDSQQAATDSGAAVSQESLNATAAAAAMAVQSILKRGASDINSPDKKKNEPSPPQKRAKTSSGSNEKDQKLRRSNSGSKRDRHHSSSSSHDPKEVRVLHILKKHRGSRRPASWRNPKITDTKEKAISDLRELLSVLNESKGDKKELRATFEELAKTESDCSSAKRGGDLGYFGRKKMQPAFEKASFGLRVGQLSDIVDTSSGVHLILRLG